MGLISIIKGLFSSSKTIYRIGISPGHGGEDPGAISVLGDHEAVLSRKLAVLLKARLDKNPMFRTTIYGLNQIKKSYEIRVRESDNNKDDFYLPLHFNSGGGANTNGWLLLLNADDVSENSRIAKLASSILMQLQAQYKLGTVSYGDAKNGISIGAEKDIYELTKPFAATLYHELGFLSNDEWSHLLRYDSTFINMANAIATGLENFLKPPVIVPPVSPSPINTPLVPQAV